MPLEKSTTIHEVLHFYHIPDHIRFLVQSLYSNFSTSVITSEYQTPFITVGRSVLQGDCLSSLLSNMCFNTFIPHIKYEKYRQVGFFEKHNFVSGLHPTHWFQFADDAAVINNLKHENQNLLNWFAIWCQRFGPCL